MNINTDPSHDAPPYAPSPSRPPCTTSLARDLRRRAAYMAERAAYRVACHGCGQPMVPDLIPRKPGDARLCGACLVARDRSRVAQFYREIVPLAARWAEHKASQREISSR
jgi:hypothetical protein